MRNSFYSIQKVALFVLIAMSQFGVRAQNALYVSTRGNDSNPGSKPSPLKTLQRAVELSRLSRCRLIRIAAGTYYGVNVQLNQADSGLTIENLEGGKVKLLGAELLKPSGKTENGWLIADIPNSRNRNWDFRMLIVNNNISRRSRLPESGEFTYKNSWTGKVLPASEGYWDKKPKYEDLNILKYSEFDLDSIDCNNAEITLPHQWKVSYLGVSKQDLKNHTLEFLYPASNPLGSFLRENPDANKFVLWNTQQGMKSPGQWYLDRSSEKLYYWPKNGENISNVEFLVPRFRSVFNLSHATNISIIGVQISLGSNQLQNEDFGAQNIDAAITGVRTQNILLRNIFIARSGGSGIRIEGNQTKIINCKVSNVGGCGLFLSGRGHHEVIDCTVNNVGTIFKSAAGIIVEKNTNVRNLSLTNTPYSGIILNGDSISVENSRIEKVMQYLNDGAAIYCSGHSHNRLTGNTILGSGRAKIGIYYDERSSRGLVTKNSINNMPIPIHCHLASEIVFMLNKFFSMDTLTISCQRSSDIRVDRNQFISLGLQIKSYGDSLSKQSFASFKSNLIDTQEKDQSEKLKSSIHLINDIYTNTVRQVSYQLTPFMTEHQISKLFDIQSTRKRDDK